jgi:hypothetical protein
MAKMGQEYVRNLKRRTINLDLLFNTKVKKKNQQSTTFMIRDKVKINKGTDFDGDGFDCNGIPLNCNAGTNTVFTANYPIGVNEIFTDCDYKEVETEAKAEQFQIAAEDWALTEGTYGYSLFTGKDITEQVTDLTLYDQLIAGVDELLDNGYNKKDIIIVIAEKLENKFTSLNLACCDMAVKTSDSKSTLSAALGVKAVVGLPQAIINGSSTQDIAFRVYIHEYHTLFDYCVDPLEIEYYKGESVRGTRIWGKEQAGGGEIDPGNSEVHAFFAVEPLASI